MYFPQRLRFGWAASDDDTTHTRHVASPSMLEVAAPRTDHVVRKQAAGLLAARRRPTQGVRCFRRLCAHTGRPRRARGRVVC